SQAGTKELVSGLRELTAGYRDWISDQKRLIGGLSDNHKAVALQNLDRCQRVVERAESGIVMIGEDAAVREAFQLSNRGMLMQRARITWLKMAVDARPPVPELSSDHRWRPFQIFFILLCMSSIADPSTEARSAVDLLWFPTGGGKTEAYLGLTAFTIFLRRLRASNIDEVAGVTVLMRYTLRLLTIQQFQRAASLLLSCESIRRSMPDRLGEEPISLGLWVGGAATPNSLKEAAGKLRELLEGERVLEGNPYQIHSCPWCGAKMTPRDYRIGVTMLIQCPDKVCEFSGGLPLYVVDEDIYKRMPSLLIGTVDKFARLPWLASSSALFGRGEKRYLPPELIIQDELHLITGPLGTLVGLYETAIDALCQRNGIPPKIIASTATIRRAAEQCLGLFDRSLSQFPPPGMDARDSFFARQVPSEEKPGRLYIGVHAPGKSMKTTLLRVYALLLQKIYEHQSEPERRDPYWTLIGYFNSMRELGGAVRLVDDDVRERMRVLSKRAQEDQKQRYLNSVRELNSRIGSDEIPEILDQMSREMGDPAALDVLLATNMISVGVDIDRLGLMVVNGQPKMSSEYIQATSRIGRMFPGLVVTLYNWTRPRDRSHYERFVGYHSAIYSHV
ncbi:MAG: helicase-related protein, partial [Chloroflexota bacterium]